MTRWQYWLGWACAGLLYLVAQYWVLRWALRAELGDRVFRR